MEPLEKIKLTGLWKQKTRDGKTYLKGSLSPIASFLIMPNDYKESDREPDYFLYLSKNERKENGNKGASPNRDLPQDI